MRNRGHEEIIQITSKQWCLFNYKSTRFHLSTITLNLLNAFEGKPQEKFNCIKKYKRVVVHVKYEEQRVKLT